MKRGAMSTTNTAVMKLAIEVITLLVVDVERALRFYVDQVGFTLDVDYSPNDAFRVVQLTPPGSSCSIQIGRGLTDAAPGSLRNIYLVVTNLEAARNSLLERGVEVGEIRHKVPIDASGSRSLSMITRPKRTCRRSRLTSESDPKCDIAYLRASRKNRILGTLASAQNRTEQASVNSSVRIFIASSCALSKI